MSRIGRKPVPLPANVTATLDGHRITVKGPKGELARTLHSAMQVAVEEGQVVVRRPSDESEHRALHGLTRSLVANMVEGVTTGFRKQLEIVGVGYRAEGRPFGLRLALGFSHPVEYRAPAGITLSAPQPNTVVVEGTNKELVGQVAAEIRGLRPPEPYKGKGIKYAGEQIRRKAGKAGGK
ncbi:MAG TPA: 50S ribosomal protein L6 [Gemmatimonadaceae bacterium]|nr:50S ribosomal protein L6 [Gemmatimonadaceae bacterium]